MCKGLISKMKLFSDGSDLVGAEKPMDIPYMKIQRLNLVALFMWPYEQLGETKIKHLLFWQVYTFLFGTGSAMSNTLYLKANHNKISFFLMGHTYITCLLNIVAAVSMIDRLKQHGLKIHILVHKLSHFFVLYIMGMMFFGLILFNLTPLYNTIASGAFNLKDRQNVTYEPSVYHYLPFDYVHDFKGYCFTFVFNWYLSYICSALVCLIDVFIFVLVFHVWGHMKLLTNNLKEFPRPGFKDGNNISNLESTDAGNENAYDDEDTGKIITNSKMFSKEDMVVVFNG